MFVEDEVLYSMPLFDIPDNNNDSSCGVTNEMLFDKLCEVVQVVNGFQDSLNKLAENVASTGQVNKNDMPRSVVGRKKLHMYYAGKEVDDKEIYDLRYKDGLTISEILDHFSYCNDHGKLIIDRSKCRGFLNNRFRSLAASSRKA